jgi:hypothetical protein
MPPSTSRCSRLNSLPDYLDNLCPLLPNYHDHTLPDYREAEQYSLTEGDVAFIIGLTTETIDEITRELRHERV